jgi:8-hydroxy-5-deazaflavin:NADPH oxidoreductase
MKIAILGTGIVGRTLAVRLHEVGHDIVMGTRDLNATLARTGSDARGQVAFRDWLSEHPAIRLAGMSEAAAHGG